MYAIRCPHGNERQGLESPGIKRSRHGIAAGYQGKREEGASVLNECSVWPETRRGYTRQMGAIPPNAASGAHELAHEMMHHNKGAAPLPRVVRETQAGAVAFVL